MSLFFANSLIDGFFLSNALGKGIVIVQIITSVIMVAVIIGKWRELSFLTRTTRRFLHDFNSGHDVLEYYLTRRPSVNNGIEGIYKKTCERLLTLLSPDVRTLLVGRNTDGDGSAALTEREIKLVSGACEQALSDEEIRVEYGMGVIAAVVSLSPMLGLLGTVWGVLDAFAEMGSAGSANLATIAPSISSALVTTVVGLLIAIPGVIAFTKMNAMIRSIMNSMDGFAEELSTRVASEFQGRGM